MDQLVAWVKSGQRVEGTDEIVVPGERGQRRAANLRQTGRVPLNSIAWDTLTTVCTPLNVPLPT